MIAVVPLLVVPSTNSWRALRLQSTRLMHAFRRYFDDSGARSFRHHHLHEFLVIDLPITVDICLSDHLIDFLVGEFLPQVRHDVAELCGADETVSVAIEDLECL